MNIFGYDFEGPYKISGEIIYNPAVYIIVDSYNRVIDVGQVSKEGLDLSDHERRICWEENKGIYFYVADMPIRYCDKEDRDLLVSQIIEVMKHMPCAV